MSFGLGDFEAALSYARRGIEESRRSGLRNGNYPMLLTRAALLETGKGSHETAVEMG